MTNLTTVAKTNSGFSYVNNLASFQTSSTTFVDVTGVTISVPNGYYFAIIFKGGIQVSGGIQLLLGATVISAFGTPLADTVNTIAPTKNNTGAAQTCKLQMKNTGGGAYATYMDGPNLCMLATGPYINVTDLPIKCSLDTITFMDFSTNSSTGIFGAISSGTDYAPTTVTLGAIPLGGIVWSNHAALCIFDFGGTLVKI